mmetsp:Transcript_3402/g.10381  ORF Transcript_3402/g.10381 Transcript_3402/m.10381 type:complete len:229 (-) Transcript_3402:227-913(-)
MASSSPRSPRAQLINSAGHRTSSCPPSRRTPNADASRSMRALLRRSASASRRFASSRSSAAARWAARCACCSGRTFLAAAHSARLRFAADIPPSGSAGNAASARRAGGSSLGSSSSSSCLPPGCRVAASNLSSRVCSRSKPSRSVRAGGATNSACMTACASVRSRSRSAPGSLLSSHARATDCDRHPFLSRCASSRAHVPRSSSRRVNGFTNCCDATKYAARTRPSKR